MNPIKFM